MKPSLCLPKLFISSFLDAQTDALQDSGCLYLVFPD